MIVQENEIRKYLSDFKDGKIKEGLKIDIPASDDFFRYKQGTFNMILGHDNMGKTYWRTWYYLVLSIKYGKKWCIWTGENKAGQVVRDLIVFMTGKRIKELTISEVYAAQTQISQWFHFVDNKKTYNYNDLLKIFGDEDYSGCLIDPYTGLDRKYSHSDNYEFLNQTREWVNKYNRTIDVCTHPVSSSGRAGAMHPQGHQWQGHLKEPYKADTEGGKPFSNRCDDFYIVHRLPKHDTMKTYTLIYIDKIKETETGGQQTQIDLPVMFEFNSGLGFTCGGINPIKPDKKYIDLQLEPPNEWLNLDKTNEEIPEPF